MDSHHPHQLIGQANRLALFVDTGNERFTLDNQLTLSLDPVAVTDSHFAHFNHIGGERKQVVKFGGSVVDDVRAAGDAKALVRSTRSIRSWKEAGWARLGWIS